MGRGQTQLESVKEDSNWRQIRKLEMAIFTGENRTLGCLGLKGILK